MESPSLPLVLLIALAAAALALAVLRPSRVIIRDYERGLLFDRGRLRRELGAGVHWILKLFHSLQVIDTRSRVLAITGQEVLSADNVTVKLSTAIRLRVAEPAKAVAAAQSFADVIYLEAQLILRDLVAVQPIEELLAKREEIAVRLRERLEPRAAPLGLVLETVGIKDVMFPGGLKQIFAQVVEARQAAQASRCASMLRLSLAASSS
jgi:regulator of protease activity HflC (stomatin/prohibitin superfamily)